MNESQPSRREVLAGGTALIAATILSPDANAAGHDAVEPVYPDEAYSRPQNHQLPTFETLTGCQIAGDLRERKARYASVDLRLNSPAKPTAAVWQFQTRTEKQAVLVVSETLRRVPNALSFRVANRSERSVNLTVQIYEMPWEPGRESNAVAWSLGDGLTVKPGEVAVLNYNFADATHPSKPVERSVRSPIVPIVIAAQDIEPKSPYELELSELTIHYPLAVGVTATRFSCPSHIRAGQDFKVEMKVTGSGESLSLELRRDPWVLWRTQLTPEEARAVHSLAGAAIHRTLPWHVPQGQYTMGLATLGYRIGGVETRLDVGNNSKPSLPKAERRLHNGRHTFFLNNKPTSWQGYSSYDYQPGNVSEFGASGTNVMCVPTCAGQHEYHITYPTWVVPGRYDFGDLDERVGFSLEANPKAILFLRVSLALPMFWAQTHHSELALADMEPGLAVWLEQQTMPAASFASEVWRRDQATALRALIRHCKAQPWASRLAGFWLAGGTTEEWFAWGSNDGNYTDYNTLSEADFAAWLKNRHDMPAAIPTPTERRAPGRDLYPSTPEGALAAEYSQYESDLTAQTIAHLARTVKEETAGRSLVCTFYGYVLQLAGEPRQALSGHFALRRLLAEPDIDVIGGIPFFEGRDLTNGFSSYVSAYESIQAAGKLYCNENDLFSWLHHNLWYTVYDPADPRGSTISMHRRVCADDAVHGAMAQKFSLLASWHHDALLHRDFALQERVNAGALALDRTSVEEVAFVVDDSTFAWTPPETMWLYYAHKSLLLRLARTGAPVGVWLLSDINRLPRHVKFVVIASGAAARAEEIAGLRKLLAEGARTVVAVGPLGLVDRKTGKWRPEAVGELLELPIRVEDGPFPGNATIIATGQAVGGPAILNPRASSSMEGPLRYPDGLSASAVRDLPNGGRLVWCGVPPTNTALLRDWLAAAGVHLYAPQEYSVHAAREIVSITGPFNTTAQLVWPYPVRVTDMFDGWKGEGKEMACPFKAGQTRLFKVARM